MDRMIFYDDDFQFCTRKEKDEVFTTGHFMWNVTSLNQFIDAHPEQFPVIEINVEEFYTETFIDEPEKFKEEYVEAANLDRPILLCEISPDMLEIGLHDKRTRYYRQGYGVFDGTHRIIKAHRHGIKTIKAYVVHMEQHLPFIVDEKSYINYVSYWNEKIQIYKRDMASSFKNRSEWEVDSTRMLDYDPDMARS